MISSGNLETNLKFKAEPYHGVARSVEGKRWLLREYDERHALTLVQRLGLPEAVGRAMVARGIEIDKAEKFLSPTVRDFMPDPSRLKDMDIAANRIVTAIKKGEGLAVFGDYDVDGVTSSALLFKFIKSVGGQCRVHIPDRMKEGYGPNTSALLGLASAGASVVITVDCGTVAYEPLIAAADAGIDIIVVDHHAAEDNLPPAVAVVNPNRFDDTSGLGNLAAVGVVFLLIVAINRSLRSSGWYSEHQEPNLMRLLDLVALGTVCDVVHLQGLNRAFVKQGLKVLHRRENRGLRALADVSGINEPPTAYHLGFVLGPRINAGGRIGCADLGVRLLTAISDDEADDLAQRLNQLNRERQQIEQGVLEEAMEQFSQKPEGAAVVAVGDNWHPGVIGIVASRLKDHFNCPACVISTKQANGVGTGSGRSVAGVDIGACVIAARQAGLLLGGGGHQMAAGFTVPLEKVNLFREFFSERVATNITSSNIVPSLYIDGTITAAGVSMELIEAMQLLAPFGNGNAEPRFVIPSVRVKFSDVVGTDHIRCTLKSVEGGEVKGISFRALDKALGKLLLTAGDRPIHVAGRLRPNNWSGRVTPQIFIDDASPQW